MDCDMKNAIATDSANPARPFSISHALRARNLDRRAFRDAEGAGTKTRTTPMMIIPGATRPTSATVRVLIDSCMYGYDIERSRSEKGRL